MTDTSQNVTMWSGDAKNLQFTITDDSGAPYDLTGVTAIVWAMSVASFSSPILEKTLASGITINTPATNGIFTVTLDSADTTGLSGTFYHEARITDASDNPRVVATGNVTINTSNL